MLKKELFFHANLCASAKEYPGARSIGFSAIFVPPKEVDTFNSNGDLMVWMAITHCNKKDRFFNKKIARAVLRERALELVRVRDVPSKLREAHKACQVWGCSRSDFDGVLRHFV